MGGEEESGWFVFFSQYLWNTGAVAPYLITSIQLRRLHVLSCAPPPFRDYGIQQLILTNKIHIKWQPIHRDQYMFALNMRALTEMNFEEKRLYLSIDSVAFLRWS